MSLILSIAALLLGPYVYAAGQSNPTAKRAIHALIVLTIVAIIAVHIVPEALEHGGRLAILILLAGFAFPFVLERLFRRATDTAHLVVVAIAAIGLLIHAIIDGIALLPESGTGLAYAIILHRLPVGMAIWWAVQPNFGRVAAMAVFGFIIAATVIGYFVGENILAIADAKSLAMLQAFVSGSLVHVVLVGVKHQH